MGCDFKKLPFSQEYKEWFSAHKKWLSAFLFVAWSGHIGLGMSVAILGPTQPYLAKQVGVNIDNINFVWTTRSLGTCLMSVVTALIFRRFFRSTRQKLIFLAASQIITGAFLVATPFSSGFYIIMAVAAFYGMGLGLFDTSDNSLMIYIFGPEESRPFTQSLHAFVGVGFVVGSFLVTPFLPQESKGFSDFVCPENSSATNSSFSNVNDNEEMEWEPPTMVGIPVYTWPYIIIGIWHLMTASGFLLVAIFGEDMPRFSSKTEDEVETPVQSGLDSFTQVRFWKSLLVMVYIYYCITCGLEGFFQSMTYTFGICGPLKLSVDQAASLNSVYYAAFVTGRCAGIFISKFFQPRTIIFLSISGCIISSIVLTIWASTSLWGIYIGILLMGFSIAYQFPSGISWTAERFDVTGNAAFIFFTGGYTGFFSFPPLAGLTFTSGVGPIGIFYLSLGFTIALLFHFLCMNFVSKFKVKNSYDINMK